MPEDTQKQNSLLDKLNPKLAQRLREADEHIEKVKRLRKERQEKSK